MKQLQLAFTNFTRVANATGLSRPSRGRTAWLAVSFAAVLGVASLTVSKPASALFGFGGVNGATETTQWLNNFELVASVNKQAVMVATQAKQYMTELQQWNATLQNIANLPATVYSTVMAPYNTVMGANQNFVSAIHNLQNTATHFESNMKAKMAAAGKAGLPASEYMALEVTLARDKGGVYKQRLDADVRQIDDLRGRMQAVRDTAARIPGLQGNVEALGLLNQQMNMAATNLEEMRALMLRESSDKARERSQSLSANAAAIEAERQRQAEIEKAKAIADKATIKGVGNLFIRKAN